MARLNVQGLARRDPGLVRCIIPDPGYTTVSIDLSAGEPTVTAHYSQDVNYRYATFEGVGKKPHYSNGVLMIDDLYLQTMSVSPIGRQQMWEMFHSQKFSGASFIDSWLDNPDSIKRILKKEREFHKMLCIAEGTPVRIKGRGWVPIENVRKGDDVWDGESWVNTEGAYYKGYASIRCIDGVWMTEKHAIWSKNGWVENGKIAKKRCPDWSIPKENAERFSPPCARWSDVWAMVRFILRSSTVRKVPLYFGRLWMRRSLEILRQSEIWTKHRMPQVPQK